MIRYHQAQQSSIFHIAGLFRPSLWCTFGLSIVLAVIVTYVLNKISFVKEEDTTVSTFPKTVWYIYSLQLNQSTECRRIIVIKENF